MNETVRHRSRRLSASAAVFLLVSACVVLVWAGPVAAGAVSDYPEFPYPHTNYDEAYRGQYHYSARYGWLNDPNGLLYYRGTYHLFSQDNPHGLGSDTKHWGHATSTDMVHWTQKPIALEPDVHPGDLWSGAGLVDVNNVSALRTGDDDPILVFSGTNGVIVHYSTDGAKTFQTYDRGRKVAIPSGTSRDPKVFWHAPSDRWVMVVWSDGGGDGANFYTSTDLLTWTFRSRYTAGWFFECPDMFALPVDGNSGNMKWVLTDAGGEYVIGSFDGVTFQPDWAAPQRMDMGANHPGGTFYAGQVFNGVPDGRVVQMAWQPGNHGSSWTGNLTFPAELALEILPQGIRITRNPIAEIASLRSDPASFVDRTITTSPSSNPLSAISADTYEITAEFDAAGATASSFGLRLHTRSNGTYDRTVTYNRSNQTLHGRPLAPVNGRLRMRVLVDRGQLEIFGNDGELSISDNVNFNSAADSQGIQVFAEGGNVRLVSLQFHRLGRAWGVGESTLDSNLPGAWTPAGGAWTDVTAGKQGQASGDAFYLSSATGTDFTYEGDVRVVNSVAAALTFRASPDASQHYTANVDTNGLVKLWRPGHDIATFPTPITAGRTYHLKVVTTGSRIRVCLDHSTNPVIDATDSTYTSGRFGVNVFNGTAVFDNVNVNASGFLTNLAGPWKPVNGTWTAPGAGVNARSPGDTFYLSNTTGTDFTYEGDVRVINGAAAALTFRANADASQHYTANVDTAGLVKLWRPGHDIATYQTPIIPGRPYHLKVVAQGSNIRVSLGSTEVINVTDTTYASGYLGLNAFNGSAGFQNVNMSAAPNVALNKPATGSAACNSNETPAKAVNGSWTGGNSDKFCSAATTKFLQVDLGQSYSVSSVVVRHAGAGGESTSWNTRDFDIQLSSGGSSWTTVAQVRGNTASTTTHPISETGRYARLNIITPTQDGNAGTRIYEFEVYGTPAPAPRCEGTNGTNYTINDNSTVESPITISGCDGNASSSSTVEVHIVHTYIGDLIVTLVAPDGSTYTLHNRSGASADNINQTYTVNLSSEAANGAWKLRVQDAASLDTGYIDSWILTL